MQPLYKWPKYSGFSTGTGVLPRNMYRYGGHWTETDISKEQIEGTRVQNTSQQNCA